MPAAYPFVTPVDLNQFELQNARIQNLAVRPSGPVTGQVICNTSFNPARFEMWDGVQWIQLFAGTGTVTSVGLATTVPGLTITVDTANPITGAGTFTIAPLTGQAAYKVLATPAGGGALALTTLTAAYVSDFDAQVRTSRLDQMAAPTASVNLNGQKVTNLGTATAGGDAVNLNQVRALLQGQDQGTPTAYVATAAALPANTYANGAAGVGATLTGNLNGQLTVDGVALVVGDVGRYVFVKNEASGYKNGLYKITAPGDAGTAFVLTRAEEMDVSGEFPGKVIYVEDAGATQGNSVWVVTNTADPVVGTDAITFVRLNTPYDPQAGTGISIVGTTISIKALNATERAAIGVTGKYTATYGDGAATTFNFTQATHGLASNAGLQVQVQRVSDGAIVGISPSVNNTNGTVTVTHPTAPAAGAFRIIIIG